MAFGNGFFDDFVMYDERTDYGNSEFMSSEFLEHCFFIFDESGQDESCPPEEILVFFYPEKGLEMDKKLFLQGSISAMIVYASQFQSGENVKILSLSRAKFSIKKVGDFTIVVTGRIDEGDGVLQRHVEALYQAYRFYWGGLDHVAERFKNRPRREFLDCIKEQCRTLLPLLHGFRRKGRLNPFLWLPFSSPPPNTSRHFMQASNILSALELNEFNYAGCIFYESSVLCTHMDVEITRWVLNRIELSRIDLQEALKRKMKLTGNLSVDEIPPIFIPIFLTNNQLEKLGVENFEGDQALTEDNLLHEYTYILSPPSDGKYLTLCILFNAHITLAVIMSLSKLFDLRHARKIRLEVENRLTKLEQDINSVYKRGNASVSGNLRDSQNIEDKLNTYHFLTTDSLTGMTKGNILNIPQASYTERDDRFLQGAGFIHELYESPEISKVMLAGHCGLLYSRHMFSKEIFYQRSISSINVENITLEKLEENAQHVLAEQQNIQLI